MASFLNFYTIMKLSFKKSRTLIVALMASVLLFSACQDQFENDVINPDPDGLTYNDYQWGKWVRKWEEGITSWPKTGSNNVRRPQIAINDDGDVLMVMQGKNSNKIYYRTGHTKNNDPNKITWNGNKGEFSSSKKYPKVALHNNEFIIVATTTDAGSYTFPYYWSGTLSSDGALNFKTSTSGTQLYRPIQDGNFSGKVSFMVPAVTEEGLVIVISDKHSGTIRNEILFNVGRFNGSGKITFTSGNSGAARYTIKKLGAIGDSGLRAPAIALAKIGSTNDGKKYRVLITEHNDEKIYYGVGQLIDTGSGTTIDKDKGLNFIHWRNGSGNYVRTTSAYTKKLNPKDKYGMWRSSIALTNDENFIIVGDNDKQGGRVLSGHLNSLGEAVLDVGNTEEGITKLNVKGGVSRISISRSPGGKIVAAYHNKNKDENGDTYKARFNFYQEDL
ncbi:hypothetical protein [Xanthovirga aplysinae]|uniref:hypothetical protein n=1 Tax=Xanthovirga aplysinae TaxID=2529853 RepID=UPI0012BD0B35|nr:hypothetical protein [Xanthovirga aplysinae]MTI32543.1 hypothetical protein [Xanthovirga aplysinae]